MPHDAGFLFDLGMGLPAEVPFRADSLLNRDIARFHIETEKLPDFLKKRFRGLDFPLDELQRPLLFEIELPHRRSGAEIAAAFLAGLFIEGRPDNIAARLAGVKIFPGPVTETFLFHAPDYRMLLPSCPVRSAENFLFYRKKEGFRPGLPAAARGGTGGSGGRRAPTKRSLLIPPK